MSSWLGQVPRGRTAVIYELGNSGGFYSCFFFLCKAWLYARQMKWDFFVSSSNWTYRSEKGWHDYFVSLREFTPAQSYSKIKRYTHGQMKDIMNFTVDDYSLAIREIYKLRPEILQRANAWKKQIRGSYSAIQIRRGDKITGSTKEMDGHSVEDIIKRAGLRIPSGKLFVQSDDAMIAKEIQGLLPNTEVLSMNDSENGFFYDAFSRSSKEARKQHTEILLVETEVLLAAEEISADLRSNIGRFHKLAVYERVLAYPPTEIVSQPKGLIEPFHDLVPKVH